MHRSEKTLWNCRSSSHFPSGTANRSASSARGATTVQTVCASGSLAKGVELGIEIAQRAEKSLGTPVLFATATTAWILAGGAHHTGFSYALTAEHLEDFAEMAGLEFLLIDRDTRLRAFNSTVSKCAFNCIRALALVS